MIPDQVLGDLQTERINETVTIIHKATGIKTKKWKRSRSCMFWNFLQPLSRKALISFNKTGIISSVAECLFIKRHFCSYRNQESMIGFNNLYALVILRSTYTRHVYQVLPDFRFNPAVIVWDTKIHIKRCISVGLCEIIFEYKAMRQERLQWHRKSWCQSMLQGHTIINAAFLQFTIEQNSLTILVGKAFNYSWALIELLEVYHCYCCTNNK